MAVAVSAPAWLAGQTDTTSTLDDAGFQERGEGGSVSRRTAGTYPPEPGFDVAAARRP